MKKPEVKIVLGHSFGDEGKGVTVQFLCKKAITEGKKPLVIRFSGGPQAAHAIKLNGINHICSTYGSGVLLGVPTLIWDTAYFDPISAKNEYNVLKDKMADVPPLYVMPNVKIITPYEVNFGRNDGKILKDGTCGRGIFPTFKREKEGLEIHANNLTVDLNLFNLEHFYYPENTQSDCILSPEGELFEEMRENIKDNKYDFYSVVGPTVLSFYDVLIFEGSQGLLLDMERGFFPNVTPSKVGLNAFTDDKLLESLLYNAEVYLVTRTYLTRHGNGYEPTKLGFNFDLKDKFEINTENEFQGVFKTGIINFDLLNTALERHCIDYYWILYSLKFNIVVTHWDLLDNVSDFNYLFNGKKKVSTDNKDNVAMLFKYYPNNVVFNDIFINSSPESNLIKLDI